MRQISALLINPVSARMIPAFVPHGLLYIASFAIKRGYEVVVYDRNVETSTIEDVLKKFRPRVVGMGCLTGTVIDDAVAVSKQIRSFDPSIKIVWGGIHTTLYPDSVLKNDFVDFVVVGDGEKAFTGLLDVIIGDNGHVSLVDNIGYKDDNQLKYTRRSFLNMDDLSQPAWHLIQVESYIRKKFYANRVITINTSRGCPYKCSFCCVPSIHMGKWRAVSAEVIVDNLFYLKNKYGIDGFQVDDDEFDIDRSRVLKLCDLLERNKLDLKWSHFSRINIAREDVLRREKKCGLSLIEFGVESGSERMLKFLNKGQTIEQIKKAYLMCGKLRLKTSALFMVGLPTETPDELKQTVRLINQLNPHLTICTLYKPYPGTELFEYCIKNNAFQYPLDLGAVGEVYSRDINISCVPTALIRKFKRRFDLNNILKEAANCVFSANFGLLVYYVRHNLLSSLRRALKGASCRHIKI